MLRAPPGFRPSRRLGQNFLIDRAVAMRLVELARVNEGDVVLEIGAGLGSLTELLAARAGRVIAVEKDSRLVAYLSRALAHAKNVEVLEGDILYMSLPPVTKIVSTPPYSISSKLFLKLADINFKEAYMLLQREFVSRLMAKPGSANYGRLSVLVQHWAKIRVLDHVPREAFRPRPNVESLIVEVKRMDLEMDKNFEAVFKDLVTGLFSHRNKTLRAAVRRYCRRNHLFLADDLLEEIENPSLRVFQASVEKFEELASKIKNGSSAYYYTQVKGFQEV